MKTRDLVWVAVLPVAFAAGAVDFVEVAPVVAVTPLYGPVSDPRECMVPVAAPVSPYGGAVPQVSQERGMVAPIAGGVAGALIGSQVGKGRGRDAATAVGAVAGTVVADRVANPNAGGSTTGAIVGGAAGALLGNQVGQGQGRTAATAAGAIGGAMVGDRLMSNPAGASQPVPTGPGYAQGNPGLPPQPVMDRCRTVDGATHEALRGYSVVYRFLGRDVTTTVPYHPGPSIRIAIGALDAMTPQQTQYPQPAQYPPQGYQQPNYPPAYQPTGYPPPAAGYQPGYTPGAPQPVAPQTPQQILIQQVPTLLAPK